MANIVQFLVDDTSPSISYSPFGDTLSLPDSSAGWNPFFSESGFAEAQGVEGNGTSLHVTSRDGATLLVSWEGTSIQVQGNVTDADYTVELDGQEMGNHQRDLAQSVLATFQNLENGPHSVSITARISSEQRTESSLVVFDQAIIASRPPNLESSTPDNVYINSPLNSQSIAFNGRWSFVSEGDTNRHLSQSPGDRATIRFRGTAFLLQGTTSPVSGRYSVSLNNQTTTLSARSSFLAHNSLLFYATALDPNATHTVTIANEGEGQLALAEDGFRAFAVGSPDPDSTAVPPAIAQASSALPNATIAALVLGAVLGCLFICVLLYMFCICLPRRRRDRKRMSWRQHVEQSRHSFTDPRSSKAGEAHASVIDIAPRIGRQPADVDIEPQYRGSPLRNGSGNGNRRDSVLSKLKGFWKWKKEVEYVNRESLGIDFAHSPDSSNGAQENEKVVPQRRQPHAISETDSERVSTTTRSLSSMAFRASRMVRKPFQWGRTYTAATGSTTNGHHQERSWSPSYQINLPFQPPLVRMQGSNADLGSEFYPAPPPSYAASVMSNVGNGTAIHSLPRSVGRESASLPVDSSPESRRRSDFLLAVPRQSYSGSDGADANTPPLALRDISQEDRGSVHGRQSGDDDPRLLGIERHVLRSLSPRTSRANFSTSQAPPPQRKKVPDQEPPKAPPAIVTLPPISSLQAPSPNTQARLSLAQNQHQARPLPPVPISPTLPPSSTSGSTAPSIDQGSAALPNSEVTIRPLPIPEAPSIHVHAPSEQPPPSLPPVIVTPMPSPTRAVPSRHSNSPLAPRGGRPPPASSLRRQPSGSHQASHRRVSMLRFASDAEQRRAFRLTPPVSFIPFPSQRRPSLDTSPSDQGHSNIHSRYSYIDFSSSDAASYLSRNPSTSASSQRDMRRYSTPPVLPSPLPEERSRWSSSNSGGEGAASSITSGIAVGKSRAGSEASSSKQDQQTKKEGSSPHGSGSSGAKSRRSAPAQITIPSNDHFIQGYASGDAPQPINNNAESPISDNNSPAISTGTAEFRYPSSDDNAPGPSGRGGGWFSARKQRRSILGQISPFQAIPPSPPSSELQQLHDDEESDSVVGPLPTGLSSPNYIIQRVLGLNSPVPLTAPATDSTQNQLRAQLSATRAQSTSSILQTFHENSSSSSHQSQHRSHARSRSASTLALLTSSLTSRFPSRGQSSGQSQQPDSRDISATL